MENKTTTSIQQFKFSHGKGGRGISCRMLDENASNSGKGTERNTCIISKAKKPAESEKKKKKSSFLCKVQGCKRVIASQSAGDNISIVHPNI